MPERYDRSACANELLLRNAIGRRIQAGWGIAPPSHLPVTVDIGVRIGRTELPLVEGGSLWGDETHASQLTGSGGVSRDTDAALTLGETQTVAEHVETTESQD